MARASRPRWPPGPPPPRRGRQPGDQLGQTGRQRAERTRLARRLAGLRFTAAVQAASSPTRSPSSAGCLDAVIAGLLFMAGMRRSEVSVLRWADITDSADGDGRLVTVRRSKTNQDGEVNDIRFVKDGGNAPQRGERAALGRQSPIPPTAMVCSSICQRRRNLGVHDSSSPLSSSRFSICSSRSRAVRTVSVLL